ncbi:MAG: nuclease-related domain-containing protein [Solirubrobacteraceae bacterium]
MSIDTQRTQLRTLSPAWRRTAVGAPTAHAGPRAVLGATVLLIGIVGLLLYGHDVSWLAGMLAGAGAAASIVLGRGAARADERRGAGGRADRQTQLALKALEPEGWRFLHDVPGSEGPHDHIAVGRGGVILIESLAPQGVVTMRSGTPILEQRRDGDAEPQRRRVRPRALDHATTFRDDVHRLTGCRTWVQAVVVFWCDFPAGVVADGRCVYIHGSRLVDWLQRRPQQLEPAETDDVFAAVEQLTRVGGELALPIAV